MPSTYVHSTCLCRYRQPSEIIRLSASICAARQIPCHIDHKSELPQLIKCYPSCGASHCPSSIHLPSSDWSTSTYMTLEQGIDLPEKERLLLSDGRAEITNSEIGHAIIDCSLNHLLWMSRPMNLCMPKQ